VLLIGIVFGAAMGYLIGYLDIQPFIVTMAGMFFARGMTAMICTDQVNITAQNWFKEIASMKVYMPFDLGAVVNKRGVKMVPYMNVPVLVSLAAVLAVFLLLRYTRTGRSMYAVGGSHTSAALMGLNVKRTKMITYILSSLLCSIGGICYCMNTMCGTTTQALGLEMKAISSAVIGGTLLTGGVGSVLGSLIGVLINGTINSIVSFNADLTRLGGTVPNVVSAFLLFSFIMLQAIFAKLRERKQN
jgi:simple sugar transport system permease protein